MLYHIECMAHVNAKKITSCPEAIHVPLPCLVSFRFRDKQGSSLWRGIKSNEMQGKSVHTSISPSTKWLAWDWLYFFTDRHTPAKAWCNSYRLTDFLQNLAGALLEPPSACMKSQILAYLQPQEPGWWLKTLIAKACKGWIWPKG